MNDFNEERADIIGQNGPTGLHYSDETFAEQHDEAAWKYRMGNISIDSSIGMLAKELLGEGEPK